MAASPVLSFEAVQAESHGWHYSDQCSDQADAVSLRAWPGTPEFAEKHKSFFSRSPGFRPKINSSSHSLSQALDKNIHKGCAGATGAVNSSHLACLPAAQPLQKAKAT